MSALKASELLRASYIGSPLLLIAVVVLWLLYRIIIWFASPLFSPLRHINGPPGTSLLLGSLKEIMEGGAYKTLCQFKEQYGHVFVIKAVLGVRVPSLSDVHRLDLQCCLELEIDNDRQESHRAYASQ